MRAAGAQFRSLILASGNSMPAASLQIQRFGYDSLRSQLLARRLTACHRTGFAGSLKQSDLRADGGRRNCASLWRLASLPPPRACLLPVQILHTVFSRQNSTQRSRQTSNFSFSSSLTFCPKFEHKPL